MMLFACKELSVVSLVPVHSFLDHRSILDSAEHERGMV
jgi:hypothetical protein